MGRIFRFEEDRQKMKVVGMPERFWVVTSPTPNSEMGDICFSCDYRQFALQVRGGLDENAIVGIYANEQDAKATATKLIAAFGEQSDVDTVTHPSPFSDWFASQDGRSILICDKASDGRIKVEPPPAWGNAWAWNIDEAGTGIVMRRVQ